MAYKDSVWAVDSTNVLDKTAYVADEQRSKGFQPYDKASSSRVNTALRQSTLVASAMLELAGSDELPTDYDKVKEDLGKILAAGGSATIFEMTGTEPSNAPTYDVATNPNTIIKYTNDSGETLYFVYVGHYTDLSDYVNYACAYAIGDTIAYVDYLNFVYLDKTSTSYPTTLKYSRSQCGVDKLALLNAVESVTYDTTNGAAITGTAKISDTEEIPATLNLPIFPGNNVTIDENEDGTGVVINATGGGSTTGTIKVVDSIDNPTSSSDTFVQYGGAIYCLVEE